MASAYAAWAPQLRQLLTACGDFSRRPIDSLPADFSWAPRRGVTLIGDAAHLMPPMGLGVNLALLDASELAQNLCASPDDWGNAIRQAEAGICDRVRNLLPQTLDRFQDWFAPQTYANPEFAA
jgi:2-polyprenyl-6-methoxyphenol hydroxylase-like FAD-dependent oxidoreductase